MRTTLAIALTSAVLASDAAAQATRAQLPTSQEKKTTIQTPIGIDILETGGKKQVTMPDKLQKGAQEEITINDAGVKEGTVAATLARFAANPLTPPTGMAGLTDGFRIFNYSMSQAAAAKLNLILGSGGADAARKVFVYDFMFYKDDVDETGSTITWGAGARLVITARSIASTANVSSLPAIAASAQFNYIEASYNLQTIGLSGPKIALAIPNAGSYDVEQHVNLLKAIDAVRDAASDKSTVVTPKLIKLDIHEDDVYLEALARAMALRAIVAGKSCNQAKDFLANGNVPVASDAVAATYTELQGKCSGERPTAALLQARVAEYFRQSGWKP